MRKFRLIRILIVEGVVVVVVVVVMVVVVLVIVGVDLEGIVLMIGDAMWCVGINSIDKKNIYLTGYHFILLL